MKILITGGLGYIAKAITERLKNTNEIISIARETESLESHRWSKNNVTYIFADIADEFELDKIFFKYSPDCVINTAACKYVGLCEENPTQAINDNIKGAENIVHMCQKYNTKLIHISTDKAVMPTTLYGATKLIGERLVLSINGTVVRLVNIKGSSGSIIDKWKQQKNEGKKITVYSKDISRYMISLEEVVNVVCKTINNDYLGKIVIPKNREDVNIYEFAKSFYDENDIEITQLPSHEKEHELLYLPYETNIVEV